MDTQTALSQEEITVVKELRNPSTLAAMPPEKRQRAQHLLSWLDSWKRHALAENHLMQTTAALTTAQTKQQQAQAVRDPLLEKVVVRRQAAGDDEVKLAEVALEVAKINANYRAATAKLDIESLNQSVTAAKNALESAKHAEADAYARMTADVATTHG